MLRITNKLNNMHYDIARPHTTIIPNSAKVDSDLYNNETFPGRDNQGKFPIANMKFSLNLYNYIITIKIL